MPVTVPNRLLPSAGGRFRWRQSTLERLTIGLSFLIVTILLLAMAAFPAATGLLPIAALVIFGAGAVVAWRFHRRGLRSLRQLTQLVEKVRACDFSAQADIEFSVEMDRLAVAIDRMKVAFGKKVADAGKLNQRSERLLEEVIPIGVELMTEKDFNGLLERMLRLAQTFCCADAGTLYLKTEDNYLRFEIIHTDSLGVSMGGVSDQKVPFPALPLYDPGTRDPNHKLLATYVALTGETYNFPGCEDKGLFHEQVRQSVLYNSYRIHSMLTIPLKNSSHQVLGVLQLINAQDPDSQEFVPFDANIQRWMESFSYLAVAALEAYIREQKLKKEIEQLRFEVDVVKRERQVAEITETDFFKRISARAIELRQRRKSG